MTLPEAPETRLIRPTVCGVTQNLWIKRNEVQALRCEEDIKQRFYTDDPFETHKGPFHFILILRGGAEIKLDQAVPDPWGGDEATAFVQRIREELERQFWPTGDPYRT